MRFSEGGDLHCSRGSRRVLPPLPGGDKTQRKDHEQHRYGGEGCVKPHLFEIGLWWAESTSTTEVADLSRNTGSYVQPSCRYIVKAPNKAVIRSTEDLDADLQILLDVHACGSEFTPYLVIQQPFVLGIALGIHEPASWSRRYNTRRRRHTELPSGLCTDYISYHLRLVYSLSTSI